MNKSDYWLLFAIVNFWVFVLILPSLCKKLARDFYTEKFLHNRCQKELDNYGDSR